ncbi:MAG: RNHCP domain-containing protein [Candidatus Daviesbacteria bacterium]|nr:RNHCP domain-containing protein [Candidatus Daviesbacteria bacterium]
MCEVCGMFVIGNGYTDHCSNCLYGKHVDDQTPGDRSSDCCGLLKPIGIRSKHGKYQIQYSCAKCSKISYCKTVDNDNFDEILKLMQ